MGPFKRLVAVDNFPKSDWVTEGKLEKMLESFDEKVSEVLKKSKLSVPKLQKLILYELKMEAMETNGPSLNAMPPITIVVETDKKKKNPPSRKRSGEEIEAAKSKKRKKTKKICKKRRK